MHLSDIKEWIAVIQKVVTLLATLVAAFWAWSRYVVERGLVPPSQMDLTLKTIGSLNSATLLEIGVRIHNKGSSALIVTDLRIRLRYLDDSDEIQVIPQPEKAAFGRINFPNAHVLNGLGSEVRTTNEPVHGRVSQLASGEFLLVPYDTFVQPGVEQLYTFNTALPSTAAYLLVRSSFRYEMHPSKTQSFVLKVSRRVGMIQYSLDHIREPHTVEKAFKIRKGEAE